MPKIAIVLWLNDLAVYIANLSPMLLLQILFINTIKIYASTTDSVMSIFI